MFISLPRAAAERAPIVWYRASEECPSGAEFLSKLSGAAANARLAEAGDRMDFVVTLQAAGAETLGRLERQTLSGTIAIRELRDASCQRVADALALSLTLGLQRSEEPPAARVAMAPDPGEGAPGQASSPNSVAEPDSRQLPAQQKPPAPSGAKAGAVPAFKDNKGGSRPARSDGWWLGAQGGAISGLAPGPLARVAAFVDREGALRSLAPRLSFRLAVTGALGSNATAVDSVSQWLLGGRLEGCPWRWGGASSLRPCIVFELGAAGARGSQVTGLDDVGPWVAPGAAVRGGLAVASRLRLEAELGALFPLRRHDVYAGSQALYRAEIASPFAALGISWGTP